MGWDEDEVLLAEAAEQLKISDECFKRYMTENKTQLKEIIQYYCHHSPLWSKISISGNILDPRTIRLGGVYARRIHRRY